MAASDVIWVISAISLLFSHVTGDRSEMKEDEMQVSEFDVKPGADTHQFVQKYGQFTCTFTYKAQGGTHEKWGMSLSNNKEGTKHLCAVERPGGVSYLFFEEFKIEVSGAQLQDVSAQSEPTRDLKSAEYIVMKKENYVKQVDGKFESKLCRVEVYATSGRQDL